MKKRSMALLLALVILMSALAGCKGPDKGQTTAEADKTTQADKGTEGSGETKGEQPTETETDSEPKIMEFEYYGKGSSTYPETSPVWDLLMEKSGVTVNFTWVAKDAFETVLSSRIADGDLPDVIGNQAYNAFIQDLIDEGLIISLTDILEERLPNYYRLLNEDDITFSKNDTTGEMHGLGYVHSVSAYTCWSLRTDWLQKLGEKEPTTWDGWVNLWRKMKATDLNGNGELDEIPVTYDRDAFMAAFGIKTNGKFSVVDGEYVYDAEHPRYMEWLDAMRMLYSEGLINDYIGGGSQGDLTGANRVGTFHNSVSTCPQMNKALVEVDPNVYYQCISPITGPYGDRLIAARQKMNDHVWITKAAVEEGKLDAILEFFNYTFSDEGIFITNYGIENESYKMVNGEPVLQSPYVDKFGNARGYGIVPQCLPFYMQAKTFLTISNAGMAEADMDKFTYEAIRGNTMVNEGFYYAKPKNIATEASVEYADLLTEQKTLEDKYILGQISKDEYLSEYNALKAEGLQEVIDQAKEAYKKLAGN